MKTYIQQFAHVLSSADVARRQILSETGQMTVCCQNLTLGALNGRSALSTLVGALFKKFGIFLNTPRTPAPCEHCAFTFLSKTFFFSGFVFIFTQLRSRYAQECL
jgi:hypothetical protein